MKKIAILGCGQLGSIVADAIASGLLPDYTLCAAMSRKLPDAEALCAKAGGAACVTLDEVLAQKPDYVVETAAVQVAKESCLPVLEAGLGFIPISIGAFADADFYAKACAAAKAVAEKPAEGFNPLFIYGESGLGKTHLLYAIANGIRKQNPNANIVYIKGDEFTNELIAAIANGKNIEFRSKYRESDLFLIDDIQFIAGKESTQEEFFHTFNALYEARKQIVISSDKPPKDIPTLEERLRSRFEWGLIADISKPDLETRIAILQKKAELEHLDVPDEVNTYIATKVESNIRELEGCLTRVLAYANISHKPLSEEVAAEALRDMIPVKDPRRITPDLIMAIVAEYFSVSVDDLKSKRRNREITVPRQVAMYLIRELNGASLPRIGLEFGGRDHTTVIHACDKVAEDIQRDASMRSTVEALKKRIQGA